MRDASPAPDAPPTTTPSNEASQTKTAKDIPAVDHGLTVLMVLVLARLTRGCGRANFLSSPKEENGPKDLAQHIKNRFNIGGEVRSYEVEDWSKDIKEYQAERGSYPTAKQVMEHFAIFLTITYPSWIPTETKLRRSRARLKNISTKMSNFTSNKH